MSPHRTAKSQAIRDPVQVSEPSLGVARALKELMHAFRTIVEGEMRSRGESLSFAHAMLMITLAREPGLSGAQAARRAQVTAQTMNALLRNLESGGHVVRERNPENLRADRWFLTRQGLRHLEMGRMVADDIARKMLVPLTAPEADRLSELLRRCTHALRGLQEAKESAA